MDAQTVHCGQETFQTDLADSAIDVVIRMTILSSAPSSLTVIIISRLSNSNLRFCGSSRLLYSGLEASEISLSSSARRAIRPAVASCALHLS